MYDPNVFTLNLEQLLSGAPLDTAIGVVKVTIHSARSIKGNKIGGGTPDPFVSFSINNREELAKTKYKHNTSVLFTPSDDLWLRHSHGLFMGNRFNPTWNETKFLLVTNLADNLCLTVFDYNEHRKNTELGSVAFELGNLAEDATQDDLELPILKDGKEKGTLRFDVHYFPVLTPQVNESGVEELPDSSTSRPTEKHVHLLTVHLHQRSESSASSCTKPKTSIPLKSTQPTSTPSAKSTLDLNLLPSTARRKSATRSNPSGNPPPSTSVPTVPPLSSPSRSSTTAISLRILSLGMRAFGWRICWKRRRRPGGIGGR